MDRKDVALSRERLVDNKDPTITIDQQNNLKSSDEQISTEIQNQNATTENDQNSQKSIDFKPKYLGFTHTLLFAMFAAMIGTGAQFGYALGVMNAPSELIKNFTKNVYSKNSNVTITPYRLDLLYATSVSVIALGGVFGGLLAAPLSNRVGRKTGLLLNNIPVILGSALMVTSKFINSFESFIIGRILIGFSVGFGATVGPLYINEIAPLRVRGPFGAFFQLFVAIAVLLAQVLGLDLILGREHLWHYLFVVPVAFSLLQCTLLIFTHETPKFLLQHKRRRAAERALKWFRCETNNEIIQAELSEMEEDFQNLETNKIKISFADLLRKPLLRKSFLILSMTHVAQHFTGSFVIFYFGNVILNRANLRIEYAPFAMVSGGITYLAVAVSLVYILDKVGRRSLFLYGLIGMAAASGVICVTILKSKNIPLFHMIFLEIFAMMSHVGFSAMGPGSIPWLLSSEMFFQSERAYASAIGIIVNWLSMFCIIMSFIPLFYVIDAFVFLIYAASSCAFWLLAFLFVPETRRKTPEQVQLLVAKGTVYKTKHQL